MSVTLEDLLLTTNDPQSLLESYDKKNYGILND
jgi:hypothetical protein